MSTLNFGPLITFWTASFQNDFPGLTTITAGDIGSSTKVSGGNGNTLFDMDLATIGLDINAGNSDDLIIGTDFADDINSGGGADVIFAGDGNDDIKSGKGSDLIFGGAGDDAIDGKQEDNEGYDTAGYLGSILDFSVVQLGPIRFEVTDLNTADGDEGTDTLERIEALQFSDYTLLIDGSNNAPLIDGDDVSANEDATTSFTIDAYDFDGDALSLDNVTYSATGGGILTQTGTTTLTPNLGSGLAYSFTFDPNGDFDGLGVGDQAVETVTLTVSDGNGGSTTATFDIVVNGVNDPPVANPDSATTDEDTSVNIAVLANDSDPDGDMLMVASATALNGSVVIENDHTLTYTPDADYNGPDTISYTISDGNGGSASSTVAVTVNPVNDAPVANPDSATTDEDTSVNIAVLANDTDVDGDLLTVTGATALNGSVVVEADNTLTYTPDADYFGPDTISYDVSDGNLGTASSTVAVTVNPVNDAPVANPDSATTDEDTSVNIAVLANDTDVDGDLLTVTGATALNGTVVVEADNTLTYTPDADYNGPDTISYDISDGNLGTASSTVAVTVNPVNDNPVANPDSATVDENDAVNINVLANDTDVDGDLLTVTGATALNGTVVVEADNTLTYTPDADYFGPDTISYDVSDGNLGTASSTVAVTVNEVNNPPVANPDTATVDEDASVNINVLANDTDDDGDMLMVVSASAPNGTVQIENDFSLTYIPDPDFFGSDTITYEISDGNGGTATSTVAVTVNPVQDGPVANPDSATVDEDGSVNIAVLANDVDVDGDILTITEVRTLEDADLNGTLVIEADNTVTYTPNGDYFGPAAFEYTISDGNGGSATSTVDITVTPVNDAPIATPATINKTEDDGVFQIDLADFVDDIDPGDVLTISNVALRAGATVIPFTTLGGSVIEIDAANLGVAEGDTLFTDFTYTVTDDSGAVNDSAEGRVSVAITGAEDPPPVNTAPTANAFAVSADEAGGLISIDLADLATDPDTGDTLTITSLTRELAPTINVDVAFTQTDSQIQIDPTIFFTQGGAFEPIPPVVGDSFLSEGEVAVLGLTFVVADAAGETASDDITLTLTGDTPGAGNTPPVAQSLPFSSDPFNTPPPPEVIVDDPGTLTYTLDMNTLISDAETPDSGLTVTFGDLILGDTAGGDDGGAPTAPFAYDPATKILTITLADIGLNDGEEVLGTLSYSVSDGIDSADGQIVLNFVDPLDTPPPVPQTVLDFEPFSDAVGQTIPIGFTGDLGFSTVAVVHEGFIFQGSANVVETDEFTSGNGRPGTGPAGISSGQTTMGGDNVLVGGPSFRQEPLLDEFGDPVLDRGGNPVLTDVEDKQLTMYAEGSTFDLEADLPPARFSSAGLSEEDALSLLFQIETDAFFDLDGLSLNVTGDGTADVIVTTYVFSVTEDPINASFSNYTLTLEAADTFVFAANDATPAEVLDFNDPAFTDDGDIPNTNAAGFDNIYAVTFETSDSSLIVLDDILVTL